ncbi:MAG: orotidine-5'-phosphate decarboxylase [Alphaproteobacteria bacterium]|nr:orotidine-5'-phosphate decarboxylase [Alphaproteobacteria bacterium]
MKLRRIIDEKRTRVCLSADCTTMDELVKLSRSVGEYICAVKVHSDIIDDYDGMIMRELSVEYNFAIIDDRKFCDIGNTVAMQSRKITRYADFITVHSISGPGILAGLRENCLNNNCSILLIAEMSAANNLINGEYTRRTIEMVNGSMDIVSGFICQRKLVDEPLLHFAPGCQLEGVADGLGQRYRTPQELKKAGIDIIIVGRGIYHADDPVEAARRYRDSMN